MTQHIVFVLLGLGSGAVFASLALGLVLSYRSSGVVNLATGAVALYGAYTYSYLRDGELLLLLPGLPTSVDIGGDPGLAVAIPAAVALSALLGALLYVAIFRHVRAAPPVAKAVAALGVMVALQALFAARLGTKPVSVSPIFPKATYAIGDTQLSADRLWFAAVIAALAVALTIVLRHTRFGTATRATAESEKGAIVSGLSPHRIAIANAGLSAAVAGLGGILIAPIVPLAPSAYTLMIVPALAAALVANLQNITIAAVAALVIGMAQSEVAYLQTVHESLPRHGLAEAIPLVVILVFLVLRGRALPERGALITRTLGHAPRPRGLAIPLVAWSAAGFLALLATSGAYRAALITSFVLGVVALSLVVVTGYAGQVSFAQLALAGAGAFLLNRFTAELSVPFPIAPLLAAAGAAVVGVVFGLPALRVRGLPVAVVTLTLAVGLEALWFRNPDFTGGVNGAVVTPPSLFGIDLSAGGGGQYPRLEFGIVCLVCLVLVAVGVAVLRRSRLGSAMLAVRANERAAAAMGVNVARTKIVAFAIGAFIAGLGGSLTAYQQSLASPEVYSAFVGFGLFATVYVAGITSITGGVLAGLLASGGIVYLFLTRVFAGAGEWYDVIVGAVLVINVIQYPEGLASVAHHLTDLVARRRRPAPSAPPATEGAAPAERPRRQVATGGPTVVAVDNLSVHYGAVTAARDVSFAVPEGLIVGLIGPNGAGKTTVIDAMSGFTRYEGSVRLATGPIDGIPPHERTHLGLARTFQGLELWDDLTVEENVGVGRLRASGRPHRDVLGLLQLDEHVHRPVKELSQGQRQLVSIARTLATDPHVLLLDEPAAGLDSTETEWLGERLRDIRDAGVTIVMVDHDMSLVLDVCDQIHVLDLGVLIASGPPEEIKANPDVLRAYLGTTHAEVAK